MSQRAAGKRGRYRSIDAMNWAAQQRTGSAPANHLLIVMAALVMDKPMSTAAYEFGRKWPAHHCWAGVEALAGATQQNPKTVAAAIQVLIAAGLISVAGVEGKTSRRKVYRLHANDTESGGIRPVVMTPDLPANDTESGSIPNRSKEGNKSKRESALRPFATQRKGRTAADQGMTLRQWLDERKAAGEIPFPSDDEVFTNAEDVDINVDMLDAAWWTFRQKYLIDKPDHLDPNWRGLMRQHVRGNWLKLWRFEDKGCPSKPKWTSEGLQARKSMFADRQRDEAVAPPAPPSEQQAPPPTPMSDEEEARFRERLRQLKASWDQSPPMGAANV